MTTFFAATGTGIEVARHDGDSWRVDRHLEGVRVTCVAGMPAAPERVFAGATQQGIHASIDGGRTWTPSGLSGLTVKALAVSAPRPTMVVAGTKPAGLFVSEDAGLTWRECEPFRRIPWRRTWFSPAEWPPVGYVQAIALSATEPGVMNVGIETGGVMHSDDGGLTWTRAKGAIYDCHSLAAHPIDGMRFYQGGAGLGVAAAMSSDGGRTWRKFPGAPKRNYGWAAVHDASSPDACTYAASKAAWTAHADGRAAATLLRADAHSVQVVSPVFTDMPYALVFTPNAELTAGLAGGQVWRRKQDGMWEELPFRFSRIARSMIAL